MAKCKLMIRLTRNLKCSGGNKMVVDNLPKKKKDKTIRTSLNDILWWTTFCLIGNVKQNGCRYQNCENWKMKLCWLYLFSWKFHLVWVLYGLPGLASFAGRYFIFGNLVPYFSQSVLHRLFEKWLKVRQTDLFTYQTMYVEYVPDNRMIWHIIYLLIPMINLH